VGGGEQPVSERIAPADLRSGMRVVHPNGYVLTLDSVAEPARSFFRVVGWRDLEDGAREWVSWYPAGPVELAS
jgi:hypothetical protein